MKIILVKGDITKQQVDAVVNAANSTLQGGGGVDGAIHRAGGKAIIEECLEIRNRQGGCPTGEAVITTAGNMPAVFVIHTVGPVYEGGHHGEPEKLANCYLNSLKLAAENKIKTIAFPNISTGVYGYPKKEAAQIAITTVKNNLFKGIEEIRFVCFDDENYTLYNEILTQ
ncbi:O-acetyl-ADP-ribose deacetylase [Plebeiibacterium marinum]|uniref:O-acetyl-ADP-ribose deacetylase n=1 Tax=Plebeiibacterium marinum TaxID=2992111 RepID=A0AAE3MBH9_9BACT|nr:O-acetyl-ADP-ribose deacetylase [Plebeiobacterium marinum]MCW3804645.1 O-acetyl-ADP-ribose deacetylase [Plebeiobacterium marinum]